MIMRVWRTQVDPERATEYERFAQEESLPMFRAHPGLVGVLFGRHGRDCAVTTLWEDHASADGLERSELYRETVARITAAGFLEGDSTVERFEVHGGHLPGAL